MSYIIHLNDDQYAILQHLINEGMEVTLSPFDDIEPDAQTLHQIHETHEAVAFFNSQLRYTDEDTVQGLH